MPTTEEMALHHANPANTLSVELSEMNPTKSAMQGPDMGYSLNAVGGSPWNGGQLFSSSSIEWGTPEKFFKAVESEFGRMELDAAAREGNTLCPEFVSPEEDALSGESWRRPSMKKGLVWLNPPWGRGVGKWVEAAARQSSKNDLTVVCLLPANTDTAWWHDIIMAEAAEIRFIRGRLHFVRADGHTGPCPKGVALVVFSPHFPDAGQYQGSPWTYASPRFTSMERHR